MIGEARFPSAACAMALAIVMGMVTQEATADIMYRHQVPGLNPVPAALNDSAPEPSESDSEEPDSAEPELTYLGWGSSKTEDDCLADGGTVTEADGQNICRFYGSSGTCPAGWIAYDEWSSTSANLCTAYSNAGPGSCISFDMPSGSHDWANLIREEVTWDMGDYICSSHPVNYCAATYTSRGCI